MNGRNTYIFVNGGPNGSWKRSRGVGLSPEPCHNLTDGNQSGERLTGSQRPRTRSPERYNLFFVHNALRVFEISASSGIRFRAFSVKYNERNRKVGELTLISGTILISNRINSSPAVWPPPKRLIFNPEGYFTNCANDDPDNSSPAAKHDPGCLR